MVAGLSPRPERSKAEFMGQTGRGWGDLPFVDRAGSPDGGEREAEGHDGVDLGTELWDVGVVLESGEYC